MQRRRTKVNNPEWVRGVWGKWRYPNSQTSKAKTGWERCRRLSNHVMPCVNAWSGFAKIYSILLAVIAFTFIVPGSHTWARSKLTPSKRPAANGHSSIRIVDTGQVRCYDDSGEMDCPDRGRAFCGQDAQYEGNPPSYRDNGDGTVTDLNTGLMWSKQVETRKASLDEAKINARRMTLGGYSDWRIPNIKELYSLIDFRGYTGFSRRGSHARVPDNAIPFINTDYFDFQYGNVAAGERYIDAQWLSDTQYVGTTMGGMETLFGVNFADGRIKGYGYRRPGSVRARKKFFVRYVRGDIYGENGFLENGDGTVTDRRTGLMWIKNDSGKAMNWQEALAYAETLAYSGYDDWRLPNAKELQYIVDYSRSPDTTDSPAIDPMFQTTPIVNEAGEKDYPYFWTSTTHLDGPHPGANAVYIAFGRALGKMRGKIMDVHGAGSQRSDPKIGRATSRGPQGDLIRVRNFVRCVRGGSVKRRTAARPGDKRKFPYQIRVEQVLDQQEHTGHKGMPGHPASGRRFIERLDRNGDGRISRSEFDGPADRFDYHDRDSDGYISENEAPKGPPPGRHRPPRP